MCSFGQTLGPIYPLKESEIEKSNPFYARNISIGLSKYPKIEPLSGLNFELKIQLLFAVFGIFLGKNGQVKDQDIRGHASTTFLDVPQSKLTFGATILVVPQSCVNNPYRVIFI